MSRRSAFGHNRGGTASGCRRSVRSAASQVVVVDPVEVDGASRLVDPYPAPRSPPATRPRRSGSGGAIPGRDRRDRRPAGSRARLPDGQPALRLCARPCLAAGIYAGRVTPAVRAFRDGQPSLVSIGTSRPSTPMAAVLAEVHLLDWDGDLYGERLGVELVARLRDERPLRRRGGAGGTDACATRAGRAVLGIA